MSISLPKDPNGEQYEDLIVATLRSLGYFVESRLILRDSSKEVLELDVVASPVGQKSENQELFEVKKDGISFSNIFKLYGQCIFLKIKRGCLVSLKNVDSTYRPIYDARSQQMGIRVHCHPIDIAAFNELAEPRNTIDSAKRASIIEAAWFTQIAKRISEAAFIDECKGHPHGTLRHFARSYHFNCKSSFFTDSPLARAESLYSSYFEQPKLVGQAVEEISQGTNRTEQQVWKLLNDGNEYLWLQHLMILETSARIVIIKNALDDAILRGGAPQPTKKVKLGKWVLQIPLHELPRRFLTGIYVIQQHRYSLHLPYLFQCFVELLGGFLFYRDSDELKLLEDLSGVPSAEIVTSLKLLDHFFAPNGSSFFYEQKGKLLCLKMVPGFIRGAGSILRYYYFSLNEYSDKYDEFGWLLGKWHNALYNTLCLTLEED